MVEEHIDTNRALEVQVYNIRTRLQLYKNHKACTIHLFEIAPQFVTDYIPFQAKSDMFAQHYSGARVGRLKRGHYGVTNTNIS